MSVPELRARLATWRFIQKLGLWTSLPVSFVSALAIVFSGNALSLMLSVACMVVAVPCCTVTWIAVFKIHALDKALYQELELTGEPW